jgi:serine O-acetyltransferase
VSGRAGHLLSPSRIWALSARLHQRGWTRTARVCKGVNYVLFKTMLPPESTMTEPPHLMHHGLAVVVHPTTSFGKGVWLGHGVTIAASPAAADGTVHPVIIGDDVSIGAGSTLLARRSGPLRIGSGAMIGAGSVVLHDVAPGARVAGNPARPIQRSDPRS